MAGKDEGEDLHEVCLVQDQEIVLRMFAPGRKRGRGKDVIHYWGDKLLWDACTHSTDSSNLLHHLKWLCLRVNVKQNKKKKLGRQREGLYFRSVPPVPFVCAAVSNVASCIPGDWPGMWVCLIKNGCETLRCLLSLKNAPQIFKGEMTASRLRTPQWPSVAAPTSRSSDVPVRNS